MLQFEKTFYWSALNDFVPEDDAPRGTPLADRHGPTLIRRARQMVFNITLPPCFQLWDWVVSGEWVLAVDQWLCVPEREMESMCGSMSQASRSFSAREAHVPLEPHLFSGMPIAGATQAFLHGLLLFYCWICFIVFRGVWFRCFAYAYSGPLTCGSSLGSQ